MRLASTALAATTLVAALVALPAARAAEAPPQGVLSLQASASAEVAQDLLSVTFSTSRDGPEAAAVQSALKQAVDAALAEARRAARPGQLEVRSGNFSMFPRHSPKGGITGWQGSAEVVVEGRDIAAISQLAGRIQSLTIARVAWGLSREQREKAEADLAAQAIATYRAKAAAYAKQFGYADVVIREVQIMGSEPPPFVPVMARAKTMAMADESLPVEAGKANVTVTVSGSVQMTR